MAINVKTKQWGNSIGVIIPKDLVNDLSLNPGDEVSINIEKRKNVLQELFGSHRSKKDTKLILKEVRNDLEGDFV